MKLIITLLLALPLSAFANPFNNFVGSYEVTSSPDIVNENAGSCIRYSFEYITSVEITKDSNGYKQSHMVRFVKKNGWSDHPVMEYRNELGVFNPKDVISYAKTTGSSSQASNEIGTQTTNRIEKYIFSIKKINGAYELTMVEKLIDVDGKHRCTYTVELRK